MEIKKRNNIFLDLGAHYGEGLTEFVSKILPIDDTWKIYSFEPNPLINTEENYINNQLLQSKNLNIEFYKKAVWIKTGKILFKMYGPSGCSLGSLIGETTGDKEYRDYHSSSLVESIDLWDFINTKFKATDRIYIKMDIEWAEYEILQNMLDRGWPKNIFKMWIEFHGLNDSVFIEKSNKLIYNIESKYSTKITLWK